MKKIFVNYVNNIKSFDFNIKLYLATVFISNLGFGAFRAVFNLYILSMDMTPAFLGMMLISHLPVILCRFNRKYSRESRLILFRVAASPTFLVTVIPRRVLSVRPGQNVTIKCRSWSFFPHRDM